MKKTLFIVGLVAASATAVWAHNGVKNAAVMARMKGMSAIADNMKVMGKMAKGERAFDAEAARQASAAISVHAAKTPKLFKAKETDPKSEALPVIWDDFDDFRSKAAELERVAQGLATSITAPEDIGPAVAALGKTCKSCHNAYRE